MSNTKLVRIRDDKHTKLQKLAEIIQQERGLRRPDLGIAAETAIEEAIANRKKANKSDKSAMPQQCNG